jgi:sphinganine-1-phosphate aldolase
MEIPVTGRPRDQLAEEMRGLTSLDVDWRGGKLWSFVYFAGDDVAQVLKDAYTTFFYTNGLSPMVFRSLKKFESEVIAMTAGLLGHSEAVGNMTSGGTESIIMAVKAARDWARAERPQVTAPQMILPVTAHPAHDKAGHYLGVEPVHIPVRDDLRADVDATRAAMTDNTILVVGSAPCYPFGVIDPISELAALAEEKGICCHVDSCLGGFLLPFLRRLGYPVPPFDFSVPGVTSISADLHKYGFSVRGTSTILYRDRNLRRYQFFSQADWPGGLYGSPTMTGSRPGGAIAASWALLNYLGEEGYMRLARTIMDTTQALIDGINAIPGLQVRGKPDMSILAFGSDLLNVYALGEAMEGRGWSLELLQRPPNLHLVVTPAHKDAVGPFLADLREAAEEVSSEKPAPTGTAAMYGVLGTLPDRTRVHGAILDFIEGMTQPDQS